MKSIGIDMDCTLNNLFDVWFSRYNKDYNDTLSVLPKWDIIKYVKPECGEKIFDYIHEPGFFSSLGIQEDAASIVEWLYKQYDVYIVTAYTSDTCTDKTKWVQKNLPFFDVDKILFCNNKGLLNLDYLIDDGDHNIKAFRQKGIIYDYPHNKYLDPIKYPYRAHNWKEVKKIIKNDNK